MESNNINAEFIFSLFLKFYPQVISNLIGCDLEEIELEKNYFGRKIDAYSKVNNKIIFIENQLSKSDELHFKQVSIIINRLHKNKEAIIIWVAKSFDSDLINLVVSEIKKSNKNIEFIAIEINDEIIEEVGKLKTVHEFEVIDNLERIYFKSQESPMEVVFRSYTKCREIEYTDRNGIKIELTNKDKIMELIFEEIRKQLYYFPTVHREKKKTNIIVLGSGTNDVNYTIGINRNMELFTEIKFHNSRKELFNSMYKNRESIEKELDYLAEWDLEFFKIYSKVKYLKDKERMIKRQVRILEIFVQFFSKYKDNL